MSPVTIAVIGSGFMGATHCEAAVRAGGRIDGILGSTPQRASDLAARWHTRTFSSLDELLASPVQVVHVTSPNYLHFDHARAVLQAGKHLVCEKPLVLDTASAAQLLDLAQEAGVVAATSFNLRFYPLVHVMRERIEAGMRPCLARGSYIQDWLVGNEQWNWRVDGRRGGRLRAVADIGSHLIDMLGFVMKARPTGVFARLITTVPMRRNAQGECVPVETDDAAHLMVTWSNGVESLLALSQVSPGKRNELSVSIDGADTAMSWNSEQPDYLWIGHARGPDELVMRDPTDTPYLDGPSFPAGHIQGYGDTFVHMLRQIYADVQRGSRCAQSTYATLEDGARSVAVCEAIYRSHLGGAWEEIA